MSKTSLIVSAALTTFVAAAASPAAVFITEVSPTGSNAGYAADWFELTNRGTADVDLTGWKMDDNSNAFASAVPMAGITTLPAGRTAVFLESASGAAIPAFDTAWFGSTLPANLLVGYYNGSGVGLGSAGDAVNVFDSAGTLQARVDFGAATTGVSFDNAANANNVTLTTLSAVGTNGAFTSNTGGEVGSPGTAATPEPASLGLILAGALGLGARRRRA